MNNITVPKQYAHEMRDDRSPEYKVACIRDYVKSHKDTVISMSDFVEVAGSTAQTYVAKLRKSGHLVRYSIKTGKKGHSYGYRWIDKRIHSETQNDGTVTTVRSLGYEEWPLIGDHTHIALSNVTEKYIEDNIELLDAHEVVGMIKLKKHIKSEYERVAAQRADALKKHQESEN